MSLSGQKGSREGADPFDSECRRWNDSANEQQHPAKEERKGKMNQLHKIQ